MNPEDRKRPSVMGLFDLSGRVSLVTGARGHLGKALALALAEAGSRLVVTSRDPSAAERLARELPGSGREGHIGVALDYLDPASIERGFSEAVDRAGPIQILVNNGHEALGSDWRGVTADEFNRQLSLATGYFLLARLLRDHAVARSKPASVILLGSMYGMVGSYPEVYEGVSPSSPAAYQALKGGIIQLTRHLAVSWARDGVRVNCLSPGPFPGAKAPAALVERLEQRSPMRRMGEPHELKGAVVLLASDAGSYMTGHNLVVDGGWTAW
jgi:gluconate 5-dehydrogenase